MSYQIKYAHTNIIARDWRMLAKFYTDVFNCTAVYPERDLAGELIDRMTQIKDAHITGVHLRLPGYEDGPTLEIFAYNKPAEKAGESLVNQYGFGHIAFQVADVDAITKKVLEHGGSLYGEPVEMKIAGAGIIKVVYARDPEGNIVEIQNWKKE